MDCKNKYLKYKLKYIELKKKLETNGYSDTNKTLQRNKLGGGYEKNPDDYTLFDELIKKNLEDESWNKKTLLIDCIDGTSMQTETNKLLKYIIGKQIISPTKKHLDMALVFAVFCGFYIVVEELIKLGANPNVKYDYLPLVDIALEFYFYKTAKILMENGGQSKNYYSQSQLVSSQYNFSNDPENYVGDSNKSNKNKQIYKLFKEKMLNGSSFNFDNLSRNLFSNKLKSNIEIN